MMAWKSTYILLILIIGISACTTPMPAAPTPAATVAVDTAAPAPSTTSILMLKTAAGNFAIAGARFVDEVNGVTPGEGEKILLVLLAQPDLSKLDPAAFSLEAFQQAQQDRSQGEVHLTGDDGSDAIPTMAGWVGENFDEFAMGFRVPATASTFQLFWPGNDPIAIVP